MLVKFSVKNFRGFPQKIEWDLSNSSNYDFNTYAIKDGIVKNGIIYGPNGSGKTNFGLAVFDIVNHLTQKKKLSGYYENFAYAGAIDTHVEFDYLFRFGADTVEYSYSKDKFGLLLSETVIHNGNTVLSRGGESIMVKDFKINEQAKQLLLQGANNFSLVNFILSSFPVTKTFYLMQMKEFVDSMLWYQCLERRDFLGLDASSTNIEEYIIKNGLVEDYVHFLKEVSGQEFSFSTPQKDDKQLWCEYAGARIPFQSILSTGTSALELLYFWMQKLPVSKFVFIDEFDVFYHFSLSKAVCRKLFEMDCQLFLSSHNTLLMTNDLLRPDCNFLLDGNKIRPLCDCTDKELRYGHNIEKLYRGNAFSL